jgi:hypothetical protein
MNMEELSRLETPVTLEELKVNAGQLTIDGITHLRDKSRMSELKRLEEQQVPEKDAVLNGHSGNGVKAAEVSFNG